MVARKTKSNSDSPTYNVHVELDNRALKAKNNGLTQAVAKLQQENAELVKQLSFLQEESFEVNSKYNNLKNVISIIDSTTKTCLPKLTEVVDTFTRIIQLCSVASNISNTSRDTRVQTVKPQIVNGHVLHNPTITLSRLDNSNTSYSPQRPNTSRSSSDPSSERRTNFNSNHEEDGSRENDDNRINEPGELNTLFSSRANRGVCMGNLVCSPNNAVAEYQEDDLGMSAVEEENEDDESEQRLTPIEEEDEAEEEEEELSPRSSKQRRFLKGRLQEVRIYLNQLPNAFVEQFSGSGNISISVSPPERRSSFKNRSSSLVPEANESNISNEPSFLEEIGSSLNRTVKDARKENESLSFNSSLFNVNYSDSISAIHNLPTPSTSRLSGNILDETKTLEKLELSVSDARDKMFTALSPRNSSRSALNQSVSYDSFNKSFKNKTPPSLKSNITKRRHTSTEKRKIAQVLLNRLNMEKRLSSSPLRKVKDMIESPSMTQLSNIKTTLRSRDSGEREAVNTVNDTSSNAEDNKSDVLKIERKSRKSKKDSTLRKTRSLKKDKVLKSSPQRASPGRPKRAARPKTMKEPSLNKKMRRSK